MVFEMSWIKHRLRKITFYKKPTLVQSKGQRKQIDGEYVSDLLFNCYFLFFKPFYLVAATFGGLLVSLCVYFEIGTLAFASWSIPVDHSDLKYSHALLC